MHLSQTSELLINFSCHILNDNWACKLLSTNKKKPTAIILLLKYYLNMKKTKQLKLSCQSTGSRRLLEIEKNRRERVVEAMHNKDFLTLVGNG